jgi:uncharacterized protein (TIGR00304 family)
LADLLFVGVAIILVGFLVVFLAMMSEGKSSEDEGKRTRVKGGGVILIGPIPIIFGSDARWTSIAIVLTIVLILLVIFSGVLVGR